MLVSSVRVEPRPEWSLVREDQDPPPSSHSQLTHTDPVPFSLKLRTLSRHNSKPRGILDTSENPRPEVRDSTNHPSRLIPPGADPTPGFSSE